MGLSDLPTTIWASKPQQNSPSPTLTDSRPGHDPTHTRRAAAHRGAEAKPRPGRYPRLAVTTGRHACTAGPGQTGQLSRPARRVGVRSHLLPRRRRRRSAKATVSAASRVAAVGSADGLCPARRPPPAWRSSVGRSAPVGGPAPGAPNTAQLAPEVMHSARRPCLSGQPTAHGSLQSWAPAPNAVLPDLMVVPRCGPPVARQPRQENPLRRSGVGW